MPTNEMQQSLTDEAVELLKHMPDFQLYHDLTDSRFLQVTTLRANELDRIEQLYIRLERLAEIAWELKQTGK